MSLEQEIHQKSFENYYHRAIINIIYTNNWLMDRQMEILKPFDITLPQFNVLRILRGQYPSPATIKLVKERMLDKMSDASRIVEKLRIKNLVKRETGKEDRRNVDVCITENGLELLSTIDRHMPEIYNVMSNLDNKEIAALNGLLDKLRERA
jgi:DNA-binding MarR family transcriptional regulator